MSKIKNLIAGIHGDEDGLEAMQVVMIIAVAATVLIAVMTFGQEVMDWLGIQFALLKDADISI